ncbi:MAG: phosphate acetyltransferase [Clostridiales bacterium]|nr:phosphate acetyltransferase [Clostridiales bacterium]MBQ3047016.1 phosphate acetyltransferase [Clostridia bacterium]
MSNVLENIKKQASLLNKNIVLPEGEDSRVVKAAAETVKEGLAKVTLLGNLEEIKKANPDVCLDGVNVVDPVTDANNVKYAEMLYKAREGKINKKTGAPEYADVDAAKASILKDYTMYAALMLKAGDVDGLVSGACHSTANTLRPGLQVIKTAPGINTVSSSFIMVADRENKYNPDGVAVFADCAINIEPDAQQIADIAISSAETAKNIAGIEPRVAMLSFSTKGSGNDDKFFKSVPKMQEATAIAKAAAPDLKLDGEFQFDAAVAPEVGKLKAPDSSVAGNANVFIFPNINAGNIGYKIAQRFGGYMALGPICQGFAKPINDLSRGCSVEDVIAVIAITALQAK